MDNGNAAGRQRALRRSATAFGPPNNGPPVSLPAAFKYFVKNFSPAFLVLAAAAAWIVRVSIGRWSGWDAVVGAAILGFWPVFEWILHVHLLHFKPRTIFGKRVDPIAAYKHRAHHRDPRNGPDVFILKRVVVGGLFFFPGLFYLFLPTVPLVSTACAVFFTLAANYEWHHFLIHTTYRPKGKRYRRIWGNHRQHHYRNENYWYGVSMTTGDRILGTAPNKNDVPLSDTCYTLGQDDTLGVEEARA